jgi:penicillin amidase
MWFGALAACALGKLAAIGRSYPTLDGQTEARVAAPTWIGRDELGVPHVRARSDRDAWYGLGFVHGQDRLFQADVARRAAFGELAAWLGEDAVQLDVFARSLGLRALAEAEVQRLDPATREMLEAYTEGLNAAAADRPALPIEHRLLGVGFEPWEPADCLGIAYVMSWTLAENSRLELAAWELRGLPPEVVGPLLASDQGSPGLDAYWDGLRATPPTGPLTDAFRAWTNTFGGAPTSAASNDWVLGPGRSADGFPIVANDPHLTQSVPSLWYAADVSGATFHAAGATLPGFPGFPVGHSAHVAWGVTNVMADTTDVVVLERRGDSYVLGGEVLPFEHVAFDVEVDGEVQRHEAVRTRVGPVISALDAPTVLALRWASLELPDVLPAMLRSLATARTTAEVVAQARSAPMVVALNLVVGDDAGGYAWQTVGGMVRRKGHSGRLPYPGGDPAHGWDGLLPETPGSGPVPEGFLLTANQRPDSPLADALGAAYIPPHRADRLRELLSAETAHTAAGQTAIQADRQDGSARRYRDEWLRGVTPVAGGRCGELLRGWDLVADRDSVGATVWAVFVGELQDVVLADELTEAQRRVVSSVSTSGQAPLDAGALTRFSQDPGADAATALGRTCARLAAELGPDEAGWTWGRAHPLALRHPFAAQAPKLLRSWNMGVVGYGGTGATVSAAGHSLDGPLPREVTGMASVRVVMPLSDLGDSTLVYPGGQSGQPGARHYRSHFVDFVHDVTLPLWFDDDDVAAHVTDELWLRPVPPAPRE